MQHIARAVVPLLLVTSIGCGGCSEADEQDGDRPMNANASANNQPATNANSSNDNSQNQTTNANVNGETNGEPNNATNTSTNNLNNTSTNNDAVDWEARECNLSPAGADVVVAAQDAGEAGWPAGVSVDADGIMTAAFGLGYPIDDFTQPVVPDGLSGGALFGEWCVRRTNWFRAIEGLEPYIRFIQDEPCVTEEAMIAEANGTPHELSCGGAAQNACGGSGDPVVGGNFCFKLHWDEAQSQGGHYGGQMRPEPRYMACGYYRRWTADDSTSHRVFQDFYNHPTPGQLQGAAPELFENTQAPSAGSLTAVSVVAGGNHTCAILDDASVRCWGDSVWGQAGDGLMFRGRDVPGPAVALGGTATQLAAGHVHTCALLDDGRVQCWGANEYAQLGIDNWRGHFRQYTQHYAATPTTTVNLPADDPAVWIAAAHSSTCAGLQSGAMHCWGYALNGVLGRPTDVGDGEAPWSAFGGIIGTPSPNLQGLSNFHLGSAHGCGLTDSGGAQCWGRNWRGQVGTGTRETLYFAQVGGDFAVTADDPTLPRDVAGLTAGVAQVVAGAEHSCAIQSNGIVQCWGNNRMGQLGFDGNYVPAGDETVVEFEASPVEVCLEQPATDLALGGMHTCALLEDGTVWCWGSANHGKLGNGNFITDSPGPVQVTDLTDVVDIDARHMHTCAVTAAGEVYCWGSNYYGQLGDGSRADQAVPTLVAGF